jgi:hypothetical protein
VPVPDTGDSPLCKLHAQQEALGACAFLYAPAACATYTSALVHGVADWLRRGGMPSTAAVEMCLLQRAVQGTRGAEEDGHASCCRMRNEQTRIACLRCKRANRITTPAARQLSVALQQAPPRLRASTAPPRRASTCCARDDTQCQTHAHANTACAPHERRARVSPARHDDAGCICAQVLLNGCGPRRLSERRGGKTGARLQDTHTHRFGDSKTATAAARILVAIAAWHGRRVKGRR